MFKNNSAATPLPATGDTSILPEWEAIIAVLSAQLGDTFDCTRVWEAWSIGTMTEDDFEPTTERVDVKTVKMAFLAAFAMGFKTAEETSRSCISTVDEAWEEYREISALPRSPDEGVQLPDDETLAFMLCEADGRDPHQMTYITVEPGVQEPYGDTWNHYLPQARKFRAALSPRPATSGKGQS